MSVSGSISRRRVGSISQSGSRVDSPLPPLDIQSIQMPSNPVVVESLVVSDRKSFEEEIADGRGFQAIFRSARVLIWCCSKQADVAEQPPSAEPLDVVSHMCHLFRLGTPLCHLYNLLIPSFIDPQSPLFSNSPEPKQIEYDFPQFYDAPDGQGVKNWAKKPENAKTCQKYIAIFTMAMKQRREEGRWPGEMWALHELWGKTTGEEMEAYDSTGLTKVLQTVEMILDYLPDSAISSDSPITPYTATTSHFGHMTKPSYDVPFSLGGTGSGAGAVAALAATMNGGVHISADTNAEEMARSNSTADANAFKSVEELVSSEKRYVNELEILVRYSQELVDGQMISADRCHQIFSNIPKILDFHRKFLIKLETEYEPIEEGAGPKGWVAGRWGAPFVSSEAEFDCYGPYCANYLDAIQMVNDQMPNLLDLPPDDRPCLHPERELQAFMIKPIQRITKYRLLLEAILNTTAKHDYPYRAELEEGCFAVRRIAAGINEVTDFKAKQATVRELVDRVEDWKGHEVEKFGDLYLDDHFTVTKADQPRDYHVFLFEKMMLCCKEVVLDRKEKKTKSALRKDKGRSNAGGEKKRLALKGRIFVSNINRATITSSPDNAVNRLTIAWTVPHRLPNGYSEDVEDWFVMTGKNEETLRKWAEKVMELAEADRKRQEEHRAERIRQSGRMSASSQFQSSSHWAPPTPASDAPPFQFPPPVPGQQGYYAEDDEDAGGFRSGRTTPSISGSAIGHGYVPHPSGSGRRAQSQQSMPAQYQAELRARAMTEDQFGPSMSQWRQQSNMPHMPPLPRLASTASAMSSVSEASFGQPNSARPSLGRNMSTASRLGPAEEVDEDDHTATYERYAAPRGMARAPSHGTQPIHGTGSNYPPSMLRNRSASSPNVYQQPEVSAPPVPSSYGYGRDGQAQGQHHDGSSYFNPSGNDYHNHHNSSSATLVGGTAYFTKRVSGGGGKRSSGESHTTETSETSSGQSPATPYAHVVGELRGPTPVSRQNSADVLPGQGLLIRVRCGEFSLGVPFDITFPILYQKVAKKIRLTRGNEPPNLQIKWIDADEDEVTLKCDADVEAMFDEVKEMGMEYVNLIARG